MAGKKGKLAKRILVAIAVVVVVVVGVGAWDVNDYYRADGDALAAAADANGSADGVAVRALASGDLAFVPDQPIAGLVFYPGGKVQAEAYAPLMQQLAERGILCVLLKLPFNLAVLDMDAADGVVAQFPEVDSWMIAGHSLGGVAASDYASRHADEFDGVVLLAAYPTADLSSFDGAVVSFVGSNDGVMNRDKYADAQAKLPASAHENVIEGGNHAYFGNYGEQDGDGRASISREQQQADVVEAVVEIARVA